MVTINDIKGFIESEKYLALLCFIKKELGLNIEEEAPSSSSMNIYVNQLRFSELSLNDLESTLSEFEFIKNMVDLNLKYAEDEDEDEVIILPFYRDFLISYLIYFYLIKNCRNKLLSYLKKQGYSHPKKECECLINLYNQSVI